MQGWRQGWLARVPQPWLHSRMTWRSGVRCPLERAWAPAFSPSSPGNVAPAGTLPAGLIFTKVSTLDREAQARYEIVVEAQDAQGLRGDSGTTTVLIKLEDINDNFPIFTQSEPLPGGLGGAGGRGRDAPDSVTWGPTPHPTPRWA